MWQSRLPRVWMIAGIAVVVRCRRTRGGTAAARTASTATWTLPSVRFLNPTGIDRPEPELAVDLALDRARADRAPADRVRDVLRDDRVEELAADGEGRATSTSSSSVRARPQARVDVARAVEVRIVDQALPAGRRAGLLEVHAHRDAQVPAQPVATAALSRLGVLAASRRRRARCRARRPPAAGRPRRRGSRGPRRARAAARPRARPTAAAPRAATRGAISGSSRSIRWSRTASRAGSARELHTTATGSCIALPASCSGRPDLRQRTRRTPRRDELLRAVADRLLGTRMDLDDHPVGADRRRRERQRQHQLAPAGGVARIDDHRQRRQRLQDRDRPSGRASRGGARSRTSGSRARTGSRSRCPRRGCTPRRADSSSTVAPRPRLSSTGRPARPTSVNSG